MSTDTPAPIKRIIYKNSVPYYIARRGRKWEVLRDWEFIGECRTMNQVEQMILEDSP